MNRVVYSTDQGRHCPDCSNPIDNCQCKQPSAAPTGDGIVRLQLETKGRKGKGVTLVTGLPLAGAELKKLAKELKQRCSTGGAIKDGVIEIQGDQRKILEQTLQAKGYTVKFSGG
ncbi:translation initiation factor Sui1 [Oceanicoccus sagamiensis]|uniref:Translation initiation factor n=1 Tax=Oceanicoccus sagamiensis TaxID=716816 RepID=A0A1X9NN44_9GAMM|nr:translation initiation factor Sui1 [Oceanicoccus sagamiensis]ARN76187.1 translation initiation factor [Oceanicoccus sagamiensis]